MIKNIFPRASRHEKEVRLVAGTYGGDERKQAELYRYCSDYFQEKYRATFFADKDTAAEIFQNAFITLWENIERRKIYVADGCLYGKEGKPFTGSILTYFMRIAILKYRELARRNPRHMDIDDCIASKGADGKATMREYAEILYDMTDRSMYDIIADCVSTMSPRCREIISKFYYEGKDLGTILGETPTITSKDALKSKKHKCMETLKKTARDMFHQIER